MPLPPPPPPCPAPSSSCPPVQKRPQHSRLTIWQHVSLLGSRSPSRSCRGSLFRKAPAAALCAGATGKGRAAEGSSQEAAGCGGCRRLCAGARGEHARKLFRVACVPRTSPVPPSRALPLLRGACAIWGKKQQAEGACASAPSSGTDRMHMRTSAPRRLPSAPPLLPASGLLAPYFATFRLLASRVSPFTPCEVAN